MSLSSEQIEQIRQRVDIVQVIGARVSLKKKGQRYLGLCPFHAEKTPSFSVSAEKGLYYCFGCHAGGDVFSFLMRHQGIDFGTAARQLAREAGVEIEPEPPAVRERRRVTQQMAQTNEYAQAFFEHSLWEPSGAAARAYLNTRGIPPEQARQRRLGFGGEPGQLRAYLEAKRVGQAAAAQAGLLTADGQRSLFDGRVTFPIFAPPIRLAGFGARRLQDDGVGPKYVNSRESALFQKRCLLYGWDVAEPAIRQCNRVVLVEGYTDVLAGERAGLNETVAALGTAFTEDHARTCARLAKTAVVLFDGDASGQRASQQVCQKLLTTGLKVLVAPLAGGRDPDSVVRQDGGAALVAVVARARPALEHFIEAAFSTETQSIDERVAAATELAPLLKCLASGLERDLYTAQLAERVGVTAEQLQRHLTGRRPRPAAANRPQPPSARSPEPTPQRGLDRFEQNMLSQLLLFPSLRPRLGELAEYASDRVRPILDELARSEAAVETVLAEHLDHPALIQQLAQIRPATDETEEHLAERQERTFSDILRRLKGRHMRQNRLALLQEIQRSQERGEPTEELEERLKNLKRREQELIRPGPAA